MNEELFKKFLTNRCTKEELATIGKWIEKEKGGINCKIWFKTLWRELDQNKETPNLSGKNLLDRIHHQINLRMNAAERPILRFSRFLSRAAAILFIPFFLVSLLYFVQNRKDHLPEIVAEQEPIFQTIYCPMGNRTKLELTDHSTVWLNHGTLLRFPLEFAKEERIVYLEGEAYFEVNSDSSRPFIVIAGDNIRYRATGTAFNIMAYPDEDIVEATLKSGKLDIEKVLPDRTVKNYFELHPGQQARYYLDEKKIVYKEVNPDNFDSWKDGRLVMDDDPLNLIARKLERWYNVKIDFEQEELGALKYSGVFTNETLPQVLDLMKLATPIEYHIYPRKLKSDSTYTLPRVVIGLKAGYMLKVEENTPN